MGNVTLHSLARKGDVETLEKQIKKAKDKLASSGGGSSLTSVLDEKDAKGMTALHYASCEDRVKVVELLLREGAALDVVGGETNETAVQMAFYKGAFNVAKYLLLEHGAALDPNGEGLDYAMTPLGWACASGQSEIVEFLLSKKANVNVLDQSSLRCTALHLAAINGHIPILKLLLASGADIEARDSLGGTAFYRAAARDKDRAVLQCLLDAGSDIDAKAKWNESALELALSQQTRPALVQWLREKGARKEDETVVMAMSYYDFDYV
jgi:ankyrin repeat protein